MRRRSECIENDSDHGENAIFTLWNSCPIRLRASLIRRRAAKAKTRSACRIHGARYRNRDSADKTRCFESAEIFGTGTPQRFGKCVAVSIIQTGNPFAHCKVPARARPPWIQRARHRQSGTYHRRKFVREHRYLDDTREPRCASVFRARSAVPARPRGLDCDRRLDGSIPSTS